MTTARLMNTN